MTINDVRVSSFAKEYEGIAQSRSATETRDELIGAAKHDLRNPIASIHAFAEILLTHEANNLTSRQRAHVQTMKKAAESMNGTLERAFFAISIDSDHADRPIEIETTDLRMLLGGWVVEYESATSNVITEHHERRPAGPIFAEVDREWVRLALSAAADTVAASSNSRDDIHVSLDDRARQVVISIKSSGWDRSTSKEEYELVAGLPMSPNQLLNIDGYIVEKVMDRHGGGVDNHIDNCGQINAVLTFPKSTNVDQ